MLEISSRSQSNQQPTLSKEILLFLITGFLNPQRELVKGRACPRRWVISSLWNMQNTGFSQALLFQQKMRERREKFTFSCTYISKQQIRLHCFLTLVIKCLFKNLQSFPRCFKLNFSCITYYFCLQINKQNHFW